jgi:hypothetical protein
MPGFLECLPGFDLLEPPTARCCKSKKEKCMNRYVFIALYNLKVYQILDTDETMPVNPPDTVLGEWVDVTGNTTVQVGWSAFRVGDHWEFAAPTYDQLVREGREIATLLLADTQKWLLLNPFDYKVDLGVATPAEEAALLAFKQYVVAVSEYKNQPDFPYTITWPTIPFPFV